MTEVEKNANPAEDAVVEITWSGKKLFLDRATLEEWHNQSFEARDHFVKTHPWIVHEPARTLKHEKSTEEKEKAKPTDLSSFVVVHWNGKSLLLKREVLDQWHEQSPEERAEFLTDNPNVLMDV